MGKKKLTLRQRLRADGEKQLDALLTKATKAVDDVLEGTPLVAADLMHLASATKNKTLRSRMVGALANAAEAELERIYNNQLKLPGVEDDK